MCCDGLASTSVLGRGLDSPSWLALRYTPLAHGAMQGDPHAAMFSTPVISYAVGLASSTSCLPVRSSTWVDPLEETLSSHSSTDRSTPTGRCNIKLTTASAGTDACAQSCADFRTEAILASKDSAALHFADRSFCVDGLYGSHSIAFCEPLSTRRARDRQKTEHASLGKGLAPLHSTSPLFSPIVTPWLCSPAQAARLMGFLSYCRSTE